MLDSPHLTNKQRAVRLAKQGLRIQRTAVGKGVFATKGIIDGCCIGEIEGTVISDDEYVSRYTFDLENGTQLEPAYPFRFVNHSCEPNCAFEAISFAPESGTAVAKRVRLLLFSLCDIAIGEELTIDYSWPASFAIPCHCRAATCRGWIVDAREVQQLRE